MAKKIKKRTSPVECEKAIRITNLLFTVGGLLAVLGVALGSLLQIALIAAVVVLPGLILMMIGYALHNRWVICPHCGAFLGEESRMIRKKPDCCPACGEDL
jgi:hypothetical protein